jgi:glycosyltransferase involved in cell wall biosynthesis
MPTLTIILPVHNALSHLKKTVVSLKLNTIHDYELIIIDDNSNPETVEYIQQLVIPGVHIGKVYNDRQRWVNFNWNFGVEHAEGKYIAILNSDIEVGKCWDVGLVDALVDVDIACPYEENSHHSQPIGGGKNENIRGACFMFRAKDKHKFFPIPPQLLHWCGDFWIADQAQKIVFTEKSIIKHALAKSAEVVNRELFWSVVRGDILEYEKLTGKTETIFTQLEYVYRNLGIKTAKDLPEFE